MKFFGRLFSLLVFCMVCYSPLVQAQPGAPKTNGRIYGKVVDASTGKGLEFAVVQVFTDSTGGKPTQLLSGALTAANGDFSVDGLPVGPLFLLKVNLIGYAEQTASLSLRASGFGPVEKDLGNLKMTSSSTLKEIVIEGETPEMRMEFDKRIFEVDKSAMNAGGTAEDVLRNIPSVQVDNDGNVSVRNSAPQLFVDGRPTNLTIDQIPADAILRVEIITNPSAKYDAGGGGGGIVNIVMKNNRAQGYNGSARFGVDMRARINTGLDVNARQGKFNFFLNGSLNQRKSISTGYTDRENLGDFPTQFFQDQTSVNTGYFGRGTVGIDWFADNRNTFTLSQSLNRGAFNPLDEIRVETDTLYVPGSTPGIYDRVSDTFREFQNIGTSLLFKHLFAKEGKELTADLNFNAISSVFDGDYSNRFNETNVTRQKQTGNVRQRLYTSQIDYVNKLTDKTKIEIGARAAVREYASFYENFNEVNGVLEEIEILQVNYEYLDQVYAAYGTFSKDAGDWKYQFGLRAESSTYTAELVDTTISFRIDYPISLFPSAYITKVISEKSDMQLALNRRIARPSFMQLSPFTDYSDSLNVSRGNPELRPEFTHAAELSYQNNFSKKNTFLATAYFRYTTGVTVRQQNAEFSPVLGDDIVVTSYYNAASSTASGLEFILKSSITKWFDLTGNLNLYRSSIDGTNLDENLTNTVYSYWAKVNSTFKLPKAFTLQMNGEYVSRKALEVGSSERGGNMGGGQGGPGGGFGGSNNTVQGFVRPNYSLDLSLKKDFFKDKNLSVTVSVQDVLRSRINYTYSESPFFVQDTFRRRDPQFWRMNLIWRFGKMDATLFKRKNTRSSGEGMEG